MTFTEFHLRVSGDRMNGPLNVKPHPDRISCSGCPMAQRRHNDLEATVQLAVDGSTNHVDLKVFDSQNRLQSINGLQSPIHRFP
jgi:hypothetical protein